MNGAKRQRVVFVGIDGGSWNVIEPMAAAGQLPNLAALMRGGSYGPLRSTIPVNSSVAWASFMTGCHAGKHGVFFFREQRHGSYQRPVISFRSIQAPTLWKLASEMGRKVVVLYFPLTFPPERVNGAMIGGLLTPDRDSDFIWPPELRQELQRAVGDVPSDNEPEKLFHAGDLKGAEQSLLHVAEQITRIAEYCLEKLDPDLFAVVFRQADLTCHQAWCFQDPEWAARNPEQARGREHLVRLVYQRLDAALGRIRAAAARLDGAVAFGVGSDHGFGPITYRFFLNKWLVDNGYLVLKRGARLLPYTMYAQRKWRGLLRRTGLLRFFPRMTEVKGPERMILDMVDWSRTRAYSTVSGGEDVVLINLRGREPEGIVAPGAEYERLRDEIVGKLKDVRAEDGTPIVQHVFRREELWQGPQVPLAPDIQFLPVDSSVNMAASPVHPRTVEPAVEGRPAMHRITGVYLWEGPGIFRPGFRHEGPQIADMGVTILHLLGLPVDEHMDGRVMEAVFTDAYRQAHPLQRRRGHVQLGAGAGAGGSQLSADDEAKLVETMQALGYME